jgi:hypothetical protein
VAVAVEAAVLVAKVVAVGAVLVAASSERVACRNMKTTFTLFLTFFLFLQTK